MAKVVNKPILYHGTATPYLALFNEIGMPILESNTGIPIGAYITSFSYKTEESKENLCTILFTTGNPASVDNPAIQENSTIIVQWGYIYPDASSVSSPAIALKIRDVDITFDDQGTKVTLKCVDKTARIRTMPIWVPKVDSEQTFKDLMDNGFNCGMGIVIERFYYEKKDGTK